MTSPDPAPAPTPAPAPAPVSGLTVRTITPEQHLDFLRGLAARGGSASFLQTPAWGAVKSEWRRESLGWFRPGSEEPVGAGLVLYRQLPKVKRYLAYLPEGPVVDWEAADLRVWLTPMVRHLKKAGAFGVRMGPPVVTRRWDAAAVKAGVADEAVRRLGDVPPTERSQAGARVVSSCWSWAGARRPSRAGSPPASRSTTSGCRCAPPTGSPAARTTCWRG